MKLPVLLLFLLIFSHASAQEYNINKIPDSLKQNADVVKRYEEEILEIKSPGKFTWHERHVYTILNGKGDNYAEYKSLYDHFTTIDYAEAILYNEQGKELKKVKKKDMGDYADYDGFSMVQDDRYISNDFAYRSYPYTVDYEEDDTNDGVLDFDGWHPVESEDMSVQYSKYEIIAPLDYDVRYKEFNFSEDPAITVKDNKKIYIWQISNIPAQNGQDEEFVGDYKLPSMAVAPSDFEAQGYSGNMSSWKSYGKFIYELKKGRDTLPENLKKEIHLLADHLKDPMQKIKVLYNYLQNNTHYVSIQLGIGGLQPFDAGFVATKKYGDCKALSNFMIAMLKEAGLPGKYVAIRAGEDARPIVTDFSVSQFNHVICCVPLKKDTVWMDCTSADDPAGYLGGFTQNRWALLIDSGGGTMIRTPSYTYKDNVRIVKLDATIDQNGNLSGKVHLYLKAMQQDNLSLALAELSNDKTIEYFKQSINLPTFEIHNVHFRSDKNLLPSVSVDMDLTAANYAQVSGRRIFISPDVLTRISDRLSEDSERVHDVFLRNEYTELDSVEITIPAGYGIELPFHEQNLKNEFGSYTATATIVGNKICFSRRREAFSGNFPASDYDDLVNYYDQMFKSDHSKIVLVKPE